VAAGHRDELAEVADRGKELHALGRDALGLARGRGDLVDSGLAEPEEGLRVAAGAAAARRGFDVMNLVILEQADARLASRRLVSNAPHRSLLRMLCRPPGP